MDISIRRPGANFHLRAAALIIDHGRLLMVKSDDSDMYYTVGGRIRVGESSADAVLREVLEETRQPLDIDRLLFVDERFFHYNDADHHQVCFYYLMKTPVSPIPDGKPTDQPGESLVWLPIADLPNLPLVPDFLRTALQALPTLPIHLISKESQLEQKS